MKKFSKNYLYYHLIADFFAALVFGFAFSDVLFSETEAAESASFNSSALPFFILGIFLVYGVCILYQVLYLRFSAYSISEKEIRVTRGVFFRKNTVLDFSRMHAINKKQNIIQRLCGLAVLTVDSGSANTSMTAEVVIYESTAEVDRLMGILRARKSGAPIENAAAPEVPAALSAEGGDLAFTSGKKLLFSLLNIVTAAFSLLCVLLFALAVYLGLLPALQGMLAGGAFYFLVPALQISLLVLVGLSAITFLGSILQSFIGYYGFRILRAENSLEISYGLLTRHTNTFGYDRIQGVSIRQGLIRRIFGYATLQLEVIGYHEGGNDQNEGTGVGILLPLVGVREVEAVLSDLLPDYLPLKKERGASRYFPFVSWSSLFITAAFAFASLCVLLPMHLFDASAEALLSARILSLLAYIVALGVHFLGAYLAYKNAGLAVSADRITLYGGGYVRTVTTVLRRSLVSVEDVTTPMRAKQGIYTVVLHIRTNAQNNEIRVGMLDKASVEALHAALRD